MKVYIVKQDVFCVTNDSWWLRLFGIKPKWNIYILDRSEYYPFAPFFGVYRDADTGEVLNWWSDRQAALDNLRKLKKL